MAQQKQQVYEVTAPDGTVLEVTGPAGADQEQVIRQAMRLYKPKQESSPTLTESRREATRSEFEYNQPRTAAGAVREGLLTVPDMLGVTARTPLEVIKNIGGLPAKLGAAIYKAGTAPPESYIPAVKEAAPAVWEGLKRGPQEIAAGVRESDPERFTRGLVETATVIGPPVRGAAALASAPVKAAAKRVAPTVEGLTARAAANREAANLTMKEFVNAPNTLGATVQVGAKVYGKVAAPIQERTAALLARIQGRETRESLFQRMRTMQDDIPERVPVVPSAPVAAVRPGVPRHIQEQLDAARMAETPSEVFERMRAQRDDVPERVPFGGPGPAVPPPSTVLRDQFLDDVKAGRISGRPTVGSPEVNKWMGVSPKEVARGANPGRQLLEENLIADTKAQTLANVSGAMESAGRTLDDLLKKGTKAGIEIDGEEFVQNALDRALKPIGAPRDATFQAQLSGIVDDILNKYPDLKNLSPERAHALKVELGDSAKWSGVAYDSAVNQVLVDIYRSINDAIKSKVPGVEPVQNRWGNLYIAKRNIKDSISEDIVGRGRTLPGERVNPQ